MQQRSSGFVALCVLSLVWSSCVEAKKRSSTADPDSVDADGASVGADARPIADSAVAPKIDTGSSVVADAAVSGADGPSKDASASPDADKGSAGDTRPPDAGPATFAAVSAILVNHQCASCHPDDSLEHVRLGPTGLYGRLVNKTPPAAAAATCNKQILVVPRNLAKSLLYQKVIANGVLNGCGNRMPAFCDMPDPTACNLTAGEIKTVGDWILAGAPM